MQDEYRCQECPLEYEIFNLLSAKEQKKLKESCVSVKFKKNELVFKQALPVSYAFFLKNGIVKEEIEGFQKNYILNIIGDNNFLGLTTIFFDTYTFSCKVLEETNVCMYKISSFLEIMYDNKIFMHAILKRMNERIYYSQNRLMICQNLTLKAKLAYYIIWFSENIYKSKEFRLSLTREELAVFLGSSRENVVRILSEMNAEKFIEISGKRIKVLNKTKLKRIGKVK